MGGVTAETAMQEMMVLARGRFEHIEGMLGQLEATTHLLRQRRHTVATHSLGPVLLRTFGSDGRNDQMSFRP